MRKLFKKLMLLSVVVGVVVLASCGTDPVPVDDTDAIGEKDIVVAFDLSGTFDPAAYNVIPFLVGDVTNYITSAGNWDACKSEGGIKEDGTGSQILTKHGSVWKITLTMPDAKEYALVFKAANYDKTDWTNVATNFWSTIGAQNTGINNEGITVSNYKIVGVTKPGLSVTNITADAAINGFTVASNQKMVTIDVGAHGGWGVHVAGTLVADMAVTLLWTNVPSVNIATGDPVALLPFAGLVSNTNGTTAATAVGVTGDATFLHTDGTSTWNPKAGKILTLDAAAKTATITITVPSGSGRSFTAKACSTNDWNHGEEKDNQAIILPPTGAATTVTVNFSRRDLAVD
jgi:hypothetical protein